MSTDQNPTPIAGLLSLLADALDPPSAPPTRTSGDAPILDHADLVAALQHVEHGWLSVRRDGHGWLLVQFAPAPETPRRTETPAPRFGSAEQKVASLTEREREVLCLVASGATNCAIATRLFISPKTASVHVSHILAKLGATTRTEAAAYAHAAGLVQSGTIRPAGLLGHGLDGMRLVGA